MSTWGFITILSTLTYLKFPRIKKKKKGQKELSMLKDNMREDSDFAHCVYFTEFKG